MVGSRAMAAAGAWEGPGAYVRVGSPLEGPGAAPGRGPAGAGARGGAGGGRGAPPRGRRPTTGGEDWAPGEFRSSRAGGSGAGAGMGAGAGAGAEAFMDADERDAARRAAVAAVRDDRRSPLEWRTPGARLLMRMGWRRGQGCGRDRAPLRPARQRPPRARRGRQGLGFEVAPEFRKPFLARPDSSGQELARAGPAWGGMEDEYGTEVGEFDLEIAPSEETDAAGGRPGPGARLELEAPGDLRGFHAATRPTCVAAAGGAPGAATHAGLPEVPPDFVAVHRFVLPGPFERASAAGEPEAVVPPKDAAVAEAAEALARFVASMGPEFEALARERGGEGGARFRFLRGGVGAAYYKYRLALEHRKSALPAGGTRPTGTSAAARRGGGAQSATGRGEALGEEPLPGLAPRTSRPGPSGEKAGGEVAGGGVFLGGIEGGDRAALVQSLGSMFTKGDTVETTAQAQGGLRLGGRGPRGAGLPEDRPATALGTPVAPQNWLEDLKKAAFRAEEEWRPASLLCKRLGVRDPYGGKGTGPSQGSRFKTDHISLPKTAEKRRCTPAEAPERPAPLSDAAAAEEAGDFLDSLADEMPVPGPPAALAHRGPALDVFKAIFEDSESEFSGEGEGARGAPETSAELPSPGDPPGPSPRLNPELEAIFGGGEAPPPAQTPEEERGDPQLERIVGALNRYREVRKERKRRRVSRHRGSRGRGGEEGAGGGLRRGPKTLGGAPPPGGGGGATRRRPRSGRPPAGIIIAGVRTTDEGS